jgi:hypothetical protein
MASNRDSPSMRIRSTADTDIERSPALWICGCGTARRATAAQVIAGPVDATITNNQWTNVYRVPSGEFDADTARPIMAVTINWPFTITTLLTGTYWLEWGMEGSPSLSGPWVPPVSTGTSNNARQLDLTGGEPGSMGAARRLYEYQQYVELPFVICGSEVPTRRSRA